MEDRIGSPDRACGRDPTLLKGRMARSWWANGPLPARTGAHGAWGIDDRSRAAISGQGVPCRVTVLFSRLVAVVPAAPAAGYSAQMSR
jgi:hypothetical protein